MRMPTITVKFFGPARTIAGEAAIQFDIADGETVGAVAGRLAQRYPRLGETLGVRLAVNRAYVPLNQPLAQGDEIAVIPPVSGGAPEFTVALTRDPIDIAALERNLQSHAAGAIVTFAGTVRADRAEGKSLLALDYEAYEEMAVEQMAAIREKSLAQFGILSASVVHRLGRLQLGEASIAVVVASAHRAEAFDACRWIVDRVKADVPIWKKDVWSDGSESWVEPEE
jgi:molybdopterin synthase catalytic subunit